MSSSGEMGSSGENVGRAMTLLDGDWTPQQAQGLLDSLKLNCGCPTGSQKPLKGSAIGAPLTKRMQPQSRAN
jgi:hypothetical protein